MRFHTYATLWRYEIFSCICTAAWCHAIRSSSGSDDDGHDDDDDGDGDGDGDGDDDDGGGGVVDVVDIVDIVDDDFGVTGEMTLESQASRIWSHKRDIAQ